MKIILTGANGVIGSQLKHDLSDKGYELICLDKSMGHDLTDENFVKSFFLNEKSDALINCFALNDHVDVIKPEETFLDYPIDRFRNVMEVNVVALFLVCREYIRQNQNGRIVNFSSIYGYRSPRPSMYNGKHKEAAYGASKAAVSNLTKYLAVHSEGCRVNCIVPGGVENNQDDQFKTAYCNDLPSRSLMDRKDITALVDFLISDGASYCTGSEFFIDGGWNAR